MREKIERALAFLPFGLDVVRQAVAKALAESEDVIMIEAEVEHGEMGESKWTILWLNEKANYIFMSSGLHGTPGPYLFIGVLLEEEDGA